MLKTLWFDLETTGISPDSAILELGFAIEIDGAVVHTESIEMAPWEGCSISDEALAVNGIEFTTLFDRDRQTPQQALQHFHYAMGKYVDKYDKTDKFFVGGFNVKFDLPFLVDWFKREGDPYIGSWINWRTIDALPLIDLMIWSGTLNWPDRKLGSCCERAGIVLKDAHTALADVLASRELFHWALAKLEGRKELDGSAF